MSHFYEFDVISFLQDEQLAKTFRLTLCLLSMIKSCVVAHLFATSSTQLWTSTTLCVGYTYFKIIAVCLPLYSAQPVIQETGLRPVSEMVCQTNFTPHKQIGDRPPPKGKEEEEEPWLYTLWEISHVVGCMRFIPWYAHIIIYIRIAAWYDFNIIPLVVPLHDVAWLPGGYWCNCSPNGCYWKSRPSPWMQSAFFEDRPSHHAYTYMHAAGD